MNDEAIKTKILNELADSEVHVAGDGYHFTVEIISPAFESLSRVKRQQMVYAIFADEIKSGNLHALTLKTKAPGEQ